MRTGFLREDFLSDEFEVVTKLSSPEFFYPVAIHRHLPPTSPSCYAPTPFSSVGLAPDTDFTNTKVSELQIITVTTEKLLQLCLDG